MTNSNYGKSATIKHEPEVGDVYRDIKHEITLRITDVKSYWYCGVYDDGRVFDYLWLQDFVDFEYLGKAKNPITSIFEVQND